MVHVRLPMLTGIDHVIVAVRDLAAAARSVGQLSLAVVEGGAHPDLGTRNLLSWWGDSYLELVGVEDSTQAAGSWFGRSALAALGGPMDGGLVGFALASDDLAGDVAARDWEGPGFAGLVAGSRTRPDGRRVCWWTARPPGAEAHRPLVFAIEHDRTAAEWTDSERAARAAAAPADMGRLRLARLELLVPDLAVVSGRLLRGFDLRFRPSLAGGGARDADVGRQTIRLRRGAPGEVSAIVVLRGSVAARSGGAAQACTVDLPGCRLVLED
ncbi:MAG: VOC family protein [Candidatus Limnocylindrales bacterium]